MSSPSLTALAVLFVVVSAASLAVQAVALGRLFRWPTVATARGTLVYRGLLRTSMCRVLAAFAYVIFGSVILWRRSTLPVLSLAVFTAVQLLWMANATADVKLRRRLAALDSR